MIPRWTPVRRALVLLAMAAIVAGGPTAKAFVYDARTGADLASYQLTPAGALAIREARLGADHPTTAHSLGRVWPELMRPARSAARRSPPWRGS